MSRNSIVEREHPNLGRREFSHYPLSGKAGGVASANENTLTVVDGLPALPTCDLYL
jgi:hypothetical protein